MNITKYLNKWFLFTFVMLAITLVMSLNNIDRTSFASFFINVIYLVLFYITILRVIKYHQFSKGTLIIITTLFSILFLIIFKLLYFNHTDSFFEFSAVDTLQYHEFALRVNENELGFFEGIYNYIERGEDIEDLGAVFFTSLAYWIYPSTLMFNIFNVIAGLISLLSLHRLSSYFMDKKHAFLTALVYGISSYVLYLYSTGMKETFFVMFIILFFEQFNKFFRERKIRNLLLGLFFLFTLYFFRPAIVYMIIVSISFAIFLSYQKGILSLLILIPFLVFMIIFLFEDVETLKNRYYGSNEAIGERVSNAGIKTDTFTYVTAVLSGGIGPLPSYTPQIGRLQQSFYAVGLGFRVFLSLYFWLGLLYVFKKKDIVLTSISVFILLEIASLSLILQSFELRFNSSHLILIYIISFYWIYAQSKKKKNMAEKNKILPLYFIIVGFIIFYWNSRLF